MESGLTLDTYTWGDTFDIDVFYYYIIDAVSNPITAATVTYTIPGYPTVTEISLTPTGTAWILHWNNKYIIILIYLQIHL